MDSGEQKTRNGQLTLASSEEEFEQKSRNGQWTLGRLCSVQNRAYPARCIIEYL